MIKKYLPLAKLKARWLQLSLREQRMLMVLAPIIVVAILYAGIFKPYQRVRHSLDNQLPVLTSELDAMKEQAALAKELQEANRVVSISPDKIRTTVEESLGRVALNGYVTKLEDIGNGQVHLQASNMPFKKWVYWLERLSKEIGVSVVTAKIHSEGEGVVAIDATLAPLGSASQGQ